MQARHELKTRLKRPNRLDLCCIPYKLHIRVSVIIAGLRKTTVVISHNDCKTPMLEDCTHY